MPLRTYVDILETYPNSCHKIDMIIDRRSDSLYKYRKRELSLSATSFDAFSEMSVLA